jgi:transposase
MHARKFRCRNRLCEQRVFCERLPQVVATFARKTVRLNSALTLLAFALGGEAGSRTAQGLNLKVGGDTLLRYIRHHQLPPAAPPVVLGLDDWAKRKGKTYGTILVDLEQRKPIELLADRQAATLATWLSAHSSIEVISRDRAGEYMDGARLGAPQAIQVADRWHLLKNLSEALERSLQSRHRHLTEAAGFIRQTQSIEATASVNAGSLSLLSSREDDERRASRERSLVRYQEVKRLEQRGMSVLGIAQTLKMSRMTVYRYLRAEGFPERARHAPCNSRLRAHRAHIHQRFAAGCDNAQQLWREVAAQGYSGKPAMVVRYVQRLRVRVGALSDVEKQKQLRSKTSFARPSAKRAARWLLMEETKLSEEERSFVCELQRSSDEIKRLSELARAFQRMVKEKDEKPFGEWLEEVSLCGIKELAGFAQGLKQDFNAVVEALRSKWSNGQTEGQINRLKYLKRQMYGRAKFDLLRARVLYRGV